MNDHPNAAKLGWHITASQTRFENKTMRLREDTIAMADQDKRGFAYLEKGKAVIIVPITSSGEMVLIEQYRYPVDVECLEVPAGTGRDAQGQTLESLVRKELMEEIGARCEQVEEIGAFYSNPTITDEECHVFLALGVVLASEAKPEPMEKIEVCLKPAREAVELVRSGRMKTGPTALAVLLSEPRLRQLGFL